MYITYYTPVYILFIYKYICIFVDYDDLFEVRQTDIMNWVWVIINYHAEFQKISKRIPYSYGNKTQK